MRLLLLGAAAIGLARAIDDETPGFQFVSGERRGARRTCGGSFYTSGAAIDGGHSPGQRRHLDPQFLQTEETFYPPGALVPPWLIPPAVARPVGAPPIPAIAEEHSLTRGVVQTDGVVKSGKGFCAAEIGPGIIDVCFGVRVDVDQWALEQALDPRCVATHRRRVQLADQPVPHRGSPLMHDSEV